MRRDVPLAMVSRRVPGLPAKLLVGAGDDPQRRDLRPMDVAGRHLVTDLQRHGRAERHGQPGLQRHRPANLRRLSLQRGHDRRGQRRCAERQGPRRRQWPRFLGHGPVPMRSLAALLWLATCASAHAASFDGTWSVLQVCETTSEGARGYTWRYDAAVKDGRFVGQYRTKGQSPSMTLEGQIQPDGTATLQAQGISGDAEHSVKFAPAQTPISFR